VFHRWPGSRAVSARSRLVSRAFLSTRMDPFVRVVCNISRSPVERDGRCIPLFLRGVKFEIIEFTLSSSLLMGETHFTEFLQSRERYI
jgi:hypothetical protein